MGKVIWSPNALDDVDSIADFLAKDSIQRASLFALNIINATNKLKDFAFSGRIIPEINEPNSREIIFGNYRIMYQIGNSDVLISAVVHSSRNWNPKLM